MSYLAIARKYRPATFDEIVGQEHVTRTLRNALAKGRIHHALLFTGARGVGKTTAARALARALNCAAGPTADPCGTCVPCREVLSGVSPDLIEIDGASNNSVDDVRELRETVAYTPTHGRYKVYLIDEVHMLSKAAFNALLKTLEEPPPHVIFLFATTEPHKVLDTILSRCQRFDFKRIPEHAVVERLRGIASDEGCSISDAALRMIAHAGEGSMRDAQSLLDKVISSAGPSITDEAVVETLGLVDRRLLYEMLAGLVHGKPDEALAAIDAVYRFGFELSQFTAELLELTRNAALLALAPSAHRYVDIPEAEGQRLLEIVDGVEAEALSRLFSVLLDVHDRVARASRPRIVLEMAVARLCMVRPVLPVADLVARLEDLARSQGSRPEVRSLKAGPRSPPRRAPEPRPASVEVAPPPPREDLRPRAVVPDPPRERAQEASNQPEDAVASAVKGTPLEGCSFEVTDDALVFHAADPVAAVRARKALEKLRSALAAIGHESVIVTDGRADDPLEALTRRVKADPEILRIMAALGVREIEVRRKTGDE